MNKPTPNQTPRWADHLLSWLTPAELLEELQGDLQEQFTQRLDQVGPWRARWWYGLEALKVIRPYYLQRRVASLIHRQKGFFPKRPAPARPYFTPEHPSSPLINPDMIRNYLKIAVRNLWRHKSFSAINILGLALGLTCSLLIFLWVRDEMSMDAYHAKGPQLYRLMWRQVSDGKWNAHAGTPGPAAAELPKRFPEIIQAAGYAAQNARVTFTVGNKFSKEKGDWAGPDWFKLFSVPLLVGSPETALQSPNSLVISRRLAATYFGSLETAVGKPVRLNNQDTYLVTGVFEDMPAHSSLQYDFLLSYADFLNRNPWAREWGNPSPGTFVLLRPGTNVATLDAKLKHFLRPYLQGIDPKHPDHFDVELFLQPYEDMYLYSETENGQISGGRIQYIELFSLVAVFMLLIACINFMNLATARSARRAKEVGIRKVVGAVRWRLIGQFISEALFLTTLALGVALLLVLLLLPAFNQLTGKTIGLPLAEPAFGLALAGIILVTGLLAGSYPALYLSSLQPVRVLKGALTSASTARRFRQALVVVQFVLSMLLIIGTIVVYRQIQYIQTKNLGFNRENLLYVPLEGDLLSKYNTFRQELQRMPGIQGVTRMDYHPSAIGSGTTDVDWQGKDPNVKVEFAQVSVGYDLPSVLKMRIVEGRYFSPTFSSDTAGYVINELAARRMGYRNPVGQPLKFWGKPGKIIGVVQNFHFRSLHEPLKPLIMWYGEKREFGNLLVRTQPRQTQQALVSLERLCRRLNPAVPFTYAFADQEYQKLYRSEQLIGSLANYFSVLAIFIASLGLLGLSAFTAEQRTREIGVRKVLGASVSSLVGLLSKEFIRLVVLAILIACPFGWWLMRSWLQQYAYRIELNGWLFGLAGLLVVGIALLTVSYQSIRAALMNPVKSLQSE